MNYKIKLNTIDCFIFDVDGVLTNGCVLINGTDYQRSIHVKDSYAIQYAAKLGYKIFLITGGESEFIRKTYIKLGVTDVRLESSNKKEVFEELVKTFGVSAERSLYMGDDIPDIPLMKIIGTTTAPQDASIDVKALVDYISPLNGGMGCVRDVIEQTLRVQGKWLGDGAFTW
jgi:3-deoxy-D-manno-octulosonate 8-phosphate phosphatase (KDO 8-P phosphatase)